MNHSARFALPMLHAGQAQKEMFHNEALTIIDILLHAGVKAIALDAPPIDPQAGAAWVIGTAPLDAWSGHESEIAAWTEGGWRFLPPTSGMTVWVESAGLSARFADGAWEIGTVVAERVEIGGNRVLGPRLAAIPAPDAGTTIDAEARTAINAVLDALRAHGLIAGTEL
ncbi:DUF2793 domain-containing protein [Sphingomonas sp. ST-64]|uniref:DUF2793 domain-containing protein n=1 Tax=Sphingomonas plantiphila TaxID=3163295 RepID=A0ABW8YJ28_9SPHN